jgi:hypothetical protein
LKRTNLIIGVVAAGVIASFAWRSVSHVPAEPGRVPTAADCTPQAIRAVGDVLERSIVSARCAKIGSAFQGQRPAAD